MACTSISGASKNVDVLPSRAIFRTWPSLPVPAHSVPSLPGSSVQMNGAAVSATCVAAGPRKTRPSLSMDRFSTSPLRKSACVATVQKVAVEAESRADAASTPASETPIRFSMRGSVAAGTAVEIDRQHARAGDRGIHLQVPFAERRAPDGREVTAAAIPFEDREHRRRERRHRLAVDDRAGRARQQPNVDAVVAVRLVENLDHLADARRLHAAPQLALLDQV